jgi:hypothetical protein
LRVLPEVPRYCCMNLLPEIIIPRMDLSLFVCVCVCLYICFWVFMFNIKSAFRSLVLYAFGY